MKPKKYAKLFLLQGKKRDSARSTPEAIRSPTKRNNEDDEDEDDEVDDEIQNIKADESEDEIEISANEEGENRTPTPSSARRYQQSGRRRSSQNRPPSVASSVSSRVDGTTAQRRTPSRVKFISDEIDEEPSLVEDLISKNLVLSLEDLEANTGGPNTSPRRKFLKDLKDRKTSILSG